MADTHNLDGAEYAYSLIRKGLILGLVHVFTPDHLSALSALSVGGSWRAFALGVRWGVGHSTGLTCVTIIFIAMKGHLDLRYLGRWCDAAVGAFMMLLGLFGIRGTIAHARERRKAKDEEEEGGKINSPLQGVSVQHHSHSDDCVGIAKFCPNLDTRDPLTQRFLSFSIGLLHGVAGPGGVLAVLPTVEMTRWQSSCLYLLSFIVASTFSMGVFASAYGESTRRLGNTESVEHALRIFSSGASVIVGSVWLCLSILGKLDELMGH